MSSSAERYGYPRKGFKDISGQRFTRLLVVSFHDSPNGTARWLCRCDCGRERIFAGANLRAGRASSCGCLTREFRRELATRKWRPGYMISFKKPIHGMTGTRTYRIWKGMISRCRYVNEPRNRNYGGRGITVCERWHNFQNFLADMGEAPKGLQLDRINNDGNYEPGNCRWVTNRENSQNRRPKTKRNALGNWVAA